MQGPGLRQPVVLAYHGIGHCDPSGDPHNLMLSPEAFESQMRYLAEHCQVMSLNEVAEGKTARKRAVALTFDDAYVGVLTHAAPILERLGFPATVFLPTGFLGGANTWDPPSGCDLSIVDKAQCRALTAMGLSVESHGHRHIDMAAASYDEVREDLDASIASITSLTGKRPRFLAYPFGRHSAASRRAAAACGFTAAFSIDAPDAGVHAWWRIQVTPLDGRLLFRSKVSGAYGSLRWSPLPAAAYRIVRPVVRRMMRS